MYTTSFSPFRATLASLLLALLFATPALAHRVLLFAYVEGETVHVEANFPGNNPVHEGKIDVHATDTGEVLAQGVTDDKGLWSFPVPKAAIERGCDLLLVLDASMGHRTEWTVRAKEFLPQAPQAETATPAPAPARTPTAAATAAPLSAPDAEVLAALVAKEVDKTLQARLSPLQAQLSRMTEQGPDVAEILGGVGWILGLVGLYAWGVSRRARK